MSTVSYNVPSLTGVSFVVSFVLHAANKGVLLIFSTTRLGDYSSLVPDLFTGSFMVFRLYATSLSTLVVALCAVRES